VDTPQPRLGIQGQERKMTNFIESAASRETSVEIMDAIMWLARGDETEAVRIWEEPSEAEMIALWERVTKNGLVHANEFCWGASGSKWADGINV
jgi:hypothetical protein